MIKRRTETRGADGAPHVEEYLRLERGSGWMGANALALDPANPWETGPRRATTVATNQVTREGATMTTATYVLNAKSGHLGRCGNGCGCAAPTPEAAPRPPATEEEVRAAIERALRRDGKAVPRFLRHPRTLAPGGNQRAAPNPPPQGKIPTPEERLAAIDRVLGTLRTLDASLDQYAAERGLKFVEVPDGPQFAQPASAWNDGDGPDLIERARGDERIELRRRRQTLERKFSALTYADKRGRRGAAMRAEIDELLRQENEARVKRNFGQGEPGGSFPTGA